MGEIDWSAFGTWAAVVVALGIAVSGGVRARLHRRVQATLIAMSLYIELHECVASARKLNEYLDDKGTGGILSALLEQSSHVREQVALYCDRFPTETLDSAIPRLHVFPISCARSLMAMRASIAAVRMYGAAFKDLNEPGTRTDYEALTASLQALAGDLRKNADAALSATDKVAQENPRWWNSLIG